MTVPTSSRKGRGGTAGQTGKAAERPHATPPPTRASPPPESIVSVSEFKSPKSGKTYHVIETNEMDPYDKVERDENVRPKRAKKKHRADD
jgi:hypothetical protein